MNTVKLSRGAGWIRVILAVACFAALAWAVYAFAITHDSVRWDPTGLGDIYFPSSLVLFGITFLGAVVGAISGVAAVRSPGDGRGWVLNTVLALLLVTTIWSGYYAHISAFHDI